MLKISHLVAIAFLSSLAACYRPEPTSGSFRCSVDLGGLCPNGMICGSQGLCIRPNSEDLGKAGFDLSGDQSLILAKRSCEQRVSDGAFSHLTALTALNTNADEEHLALDSHGGSSRLLFQRGNQLFAATISTTDSKSVSTPVAIALSGAPSGIVLRGGSVNSDGKYWFSGTVSGSTSLYAATPVDATQFTVAAAHAPTAACAFSDPFFSRGDATSELYIGFALAGCGGPSYVATGALDRNIGAFFSSLTESGWTTPSLSPSGLLLITASTKDQHLYASSRSDVQFQFANAGRISLSAVGESTEDRQALISADCKTIYFSSLRQGGQGGADVYAADIAAE